VVARTEAWEFTLAKTVDNSKKVHVVIKKNLDGSVYIHLKMTSFISALMNGMFLINWYVKYIMKKESCNNTYNLENEQNKTDNVKVLGMNTFELDLKGYKLKNGYYILEVYNEKNEKYQLKVLC
jgi:hypothetical protein